MKFHCPFQPFCFIGGDVISDDDLLICMESKALPIEDTPEVEGTFTIHIATTKQYEWVEEVLKDSNFRKAKARYRELYTLFLKAGFIKTTSK